MRGRRYSLIHISVALVGLVPTERCVLGMESSKLVRSRQAVSGSRQNSDNTVHIDERSKDDDTVVVGISDDAGFDMAWKDDDHRHGTHNDSLSAQPPASLVNSMPNSSENRVIVGISDTANLDMSWTDGVSISAALVETNVSTASQCSPTGTHCCGPDNSGKCKSCQKGYELFAGACFEVGCPENTHGQNIGKGCTCNEGLGGVIVPTSTPPFYTGECKVNKCKCDKGTPVIGTECPKAGAIMCKKPCDPGYYLDDNDCVENVCKCPNGEDATGEDCKRNGGFGCRPHSCRDGYHFDAGDCKENVCACKNGKPARKTECPEHETRKCAWCNDGFEPYQGDTRCRAIGEGSGAVRAAASASGGGGPSGPECDRDCRLQKARAKKAKMRAARGHAHCGRPGLVFLAGILIAAGSG